MKHNTFRVGQCNILNGGDFPLRYRQLAEAVNAHELDYLLCQEVVLKEEFEEALSTTNLKYVNFGAPLYYKDKTFYLAIASSTPLKEPAAVKPWNLKEIMVRRTEVGEVTINLFTAHLAHGFANEVARTRSAEMIDAVAVKLEEECPSVSILGGDLNALPEARSIRYLRGLETNLLGTTSTMWVDAWETCGRSENWASNAHATNPLGRETALAVGVLDPDFIPARRIDYLMTRGWVYGKTGCPTSFDYLRHPEGAIFTDHEPFYADFLLVNE